MSMSGCLCAVPASLDPSDDAPTRIFHTAKSAEKAEICVETGFGKIRTFSLVVYGTLEHFPIMCTEPRA